MFITVLVENIDTLTPTHMLVSTTTLYLKLIIIRNLQLQKNNLNRKNDRMGVILTLTERVKEKYILKREITALTTNIFCC